MQDCKAQPTESSERANDAEEKETTKKNSASPEEGEKCTEVPKRRRT
jgi:hypothetical protein